MKIRRARDPELNILANELKHIDWVEPLSAAEEDLCETLTQDVPDASEPSGKYTPRRRWVSPLPGGQTWVVRMYLAGEQRTIGIVPHTLVSAAFRFADLAQQHFWKYRVRGACPPGATELNISEERLHKDITDETDAINLLQRIEQYLLGAGVLQTAAQRNAEKTQERVDKRVNLRKTIYENHLDVSEKLESLQTYCQSLTQKLDLVVSAVAALARRETTVQGITFTGEPGTGAPLLIQPTTVCGR